jgi:hypothetical protein
MSVHQYQGLFGQTNLSQLIIASQRWEHLQTLEPSDTMKANEHALLKKEDALRDAVEPLTSSGALFSVFGKTKTSDTIDPERESQLEDPVERDQAAALCGLVEGFLRTESVAGWGRAELD